MVLVLLLQLFYWSVLVASCGYALWRGGAPERMVAVTMAIASIISVPALSGLSDRFHKPELGVLAIDAIVLLLFLLIAARAARAWTLWIAVLQLLDVGTHLAKLASPTEILRYVYAVTAGMWAFPILLLMAIGTARHRRRLRQRGADPSWSRS